MKIPKLIAGKGYAGQEFHGCCNTGTRPCIFHLKLGGWSVGQEEACRGCMRFGLTYKDKTYYGEGNKRVWFYKSRPAAVKKFAEILGIRVAENEAVKAEILSHLDKARSGDIASALALGDY